MNKGIILKSVGLSLLTLFVLFLYSKQVHKRVNPYTNKTYYSSAKDLKIFVPANAHHDGFSLEFSEIPFSANNEGYKSVKNFNLYAIVYGGKHITEFTKPLVIEYSTPSTLSAKPEVFLYDKNRGWEKLDSEWEEKGKILRFETSVIGQFSIVVPRTEPEVSRPWGETL